jgi:hypothetical protein
VSAVPATEPRVRALAISPRLVLGGIVAAGTVLHALFARLVVTPSVFPDEYLYSQLARSIATHGRLQVRGVSAHFPAILEPLLTAPLWLVGDVHTAYRLVQVENALAMSLAAIPAYLIARRLRVSPGLALGVAALAVAGPQMTFAGMLLSEPFAYPLALATLAAALRALERPSLRAQVVLLSFCGLSVLSRMQLAVLPICIALVVLVVALRERRLRAAVREQSLFLGLIALGGLGGVAVAAVHGFGYYHLLSNVAGAGGAARLAGMDAYVVLLAAGVALAPSAVSGLALGLVRPRFRAELVFSTFAVVLTVAILLESVLWEHAHRVQERYLCYLLPLLAIGFALRWSRTDRRPVAEIGVAAGIAAVASLVPLNGFADQASHSVAPFFYSFMRLESVDHGAASTSAVFAIGITLLAAVGAAGAALKRGALPVLAVALVTSVVVLAASASWSGSLSRDVRARSLPADMSWIDHAVDADATMLVTGPAPRGAALATLFWNPSITRVVRLPQAPNVDQLHDPVVRVQRNGRVLFRGRPLRSPVVVESPLLLSVDLANARPGGSNVTTRLWLPDGDVRLASTTSNRAPNGMILHSGAIKVWSGSARVEGWVEVPVLVPATLGRTTFRLGNVKLGHVTRVTLAAGTSRVVRVAACGAAPYQGGFSAQWPESKGAYASPLLGSARYVPDPRACR